jgi:cytoplasmic iron level regulating protein YaaA (DUF328/UPF0246 family)
LLFVLSPAKTLDLTPGPAELPMTRPRFLKDTSELAGVAKRLSPADLGDLMGISDKLAELNRDRFRSFKPRSAEGVQAALAFAGDVYRGLDARSLDAEGLAWAQEHVRILSGLYGVLRPMDVIQPYRLEMGVSLRTARGATLYDFWGDKVAERRRQGPCGPYADQPGQPGVLRRGRRTGAEAAADHRDVSGGESRAEPRARVLRQASAGNDGAVRHRPPDRGG